MRWLAGLLLLTATLAGCIGSTDEALNEQSLGDGFPPEDIVWDTTGPYSKVLEEGPFDVLPVEVLEIESFDGASLQAAIWRPDVPEGERVPVVLDIGPYYSDQIDAMEDDWYEKEVYLDGLVSNGYAYGRVAVRGTAASDGCMEFFSEKEQQDMDEVITHFGEQPWSNGNVALVGGSYDGTTQWMAAMFGNPHLKTIVPLSGLTTIWEHAFRNGTPVAFAPVFHGVYWSYGWTDPGLQAMPEKKLDNTACPESIRGTAIIGPWSTLTGEKHGSAVTGEYWDVRDFRPRVLGNYNGSVFLVHGLQDWRVPPSMAFPFVNQLQDEGIEVKMLLGQWWHDAPDRASRGEHVRWDYAETLLRWFDQELKGLEVDTGPAVDVEDNRGNWRTETTWPPSDATWTTFELGEDLSEEPTDPGQRVLYSPGNAYATAEEAAFASDDTLGEGPTDYRARLGPVQEELRLAGSPRLHVTVVPSSPEGARLSAELVDVTGYPYEEARVVAHAVMDLRYHEGGAERHQLTPGEPIVAKMEFFPADVLIPVGHELELRISNGVGYSEVRDHYAPIDNFVEHPTPAPVTLEWGEGKSILELPLIERDVGDGAYPGQPR